MEIFRYLHNHRIFFVLDDVLEVDIGDFQCKGNTPVGFIKGAQRSNMKQYQYFSEVLKDFNITGDQLINYVRAAIIFKAEHGGVPKCHFGL